MIFTFGSHGWTLTSVIDGKSFVVLALVQMYTFNRTREIVALSADCHVFFPFYSFQMCAIFLSHFYFFLSWSRSPSHLIAIHTHTLYYCRCVLASACQRALMANVLD